MLTDVKVVKPIQFSAFQFYKKFRSAADYTTVSWEKKFRITHSTWDSHPSWKRKINLSANEVKFTTETKDKIYYFLNFGTRKRYAVMPNGWRSKTRPGQFSARAGGTPFNRNAPGAWDWREWAAIARAIDAREFDKQVLSQTEKQIGRTFKYAMQQGVIDSGHKYGR